MAGLQPCIYCYVLRYLTLGTLAVSLSALVFPNWTADISAAIMALSVVGTGVSAYLILDDLFPASSICTACSYAPLIFGVSLYYYSIAFMAIVLGVSVTVFRTGYKPV